MILSHPRKLSVTSIGLAVLTLAIVGNARADDAQLNRATRNWAGYADVNSPGSQFTSISGTWTVPTITPTPSTYVSAWVGLDGYNSGTVEQIGIIAQDDPNTGLTYNGIYEFYPDDSVTIPSSSLLISPGDSVTASVAYNFTSDSGDYMTVSLNNHTNGQTYSFAQFVSGAARSSAEWIVEPPSFGGQIASMANFGSITFTDVSAALDGSGGLIGDFSPTGLDIHAFSGYNAVTSALDETGTSFTVTAIVPEPGSIALLTLAGMAFHRRRRL